MISDLLTRPSGYRADPAGYLKNQLGHAYVVAALPCLLLGPWLLLVLVPGYIAWEVLQWRRYAAEPWDCAEDLAHVLIGAAVALGAWWLIAIHAALLASGALRRLSERADPSSFTPV